MSGAIRDLLEHDHRRLDALLDTAIGSAAIDREAYEAFRAGLLRHIGMEEKILLPAAKRLRGGEALQAARQLRLDHGALVGLLVPTPTRALLERLRAVLTLHNPLEEGPHGIYAACEALAGAGTDELVAELRAAPEVPLAPHFDGPRAFENIERLLRAAGEARGDAELFTRG